MQTHTRPIVLVATSVALAALALPAPGRARARASGSAPTSAPRMELLWPGGAPGALGDADEDKPAVTIYPADPSRAVGTAVVVCPGGGYGMLASDHEGAQVARWLNTLGVTALVLRYRLGPRYHHPSMLVDAQRAVRYARSHASDLGVAPDRVGILGFSAGGHLASTAGTHFDDGDPHAADPIERAGSRPDFMVLGYPVITLEPPYAHEGSRQNLLGDAPDPKLVESLSNEKQVTARTPPTFLFHTTDDDAVPVENSVMFYLALRKAGVPAEMHLYAHGTHGVGLAPADPVLSTWPARAADWLKVIGMLPSHR
jgi:acetyl esterase/lipase